MDPITDRQKSSFKCIWMSAGVVNYKLCDLNFECEGCEFNRVMQGSLPGTKTATSENDVSENHPLMLQYLASILEDCKIHLDRYYHITHFWFKCDSQKTARVGINPLSLRMVYPLERIIIPNPGEHFHEKQLIAWIVRKESTIPLHIPVKCEITEVNPVFLIKGTAAVLKENGYLFKISGDNLVSEIKKLCGSMGSTENHQNQISVLKTYLQKSIERNNTSTLGVTLGDGGTYERDLENIIGKKLYQELIQDLFYSGQGNN